MKILFIADIHGSTIVFKKALSTAIKYSIDLVIISGDLSGKNNITFTKQSNNYYILNYYENQLQKEIIENLPVFLESCDLTGHYPILLSENDFLECLDDNNKAKFLIRKAIENRFLTWLDYLEEIQGNFKVLFSPGNDDSYHIDSFFKKRARENTFYSVDDYCTFEKYSIVNYSKVTPTPWNTPRELEDKKIDTQLTNLISNSINDYPMNSLIFNFHCPPFETILDIAPKINSKFELQVEAGSIKSDHIGSRSIYNLIKRFQPILSLHGHAHESHGTCLINSTLCINPGSEYGQGILRGQIIEVENTKVINHFRIER